MPDNQPHATVIFTLSFSTSLLVNGIINIGLAHLINLALNKYIMLGIFIIIIFINYIVFYRAGRAKKIVKEKPMFFNNHKLSIVLTLLYFLFTSSFLFWVAGYVGSILGTI